MWCGIDSIEYILLYNKLATMACPVESEMVDQICQKCGGMKSEQSQLCNWCLHNWYEETPQENPVVENPLAENPLMKVVANTLRWGKLKQEYIDILLANVKDYELAFTAKSYDNENNYEILELLGDGSASAFLPWYFINRFPNLNCTAGLKILARLKINYASKRSFSEIANSLGFWPHIRASEDEKSGNPMGLLEDVFEAFIAVTVGTLDKYFMLDGVGYGVVYQMLKALFDNIDISLEYSDLYDPKTRLKEIFDTARGSLGSLVYMDKDRSSLVMRVLDDGKRIVMGEGVELPQKIERQQEAARQALKLFGPEEDARRAIHNQLLVSCAEKVAKRNS